MNLVRYFGVWQILLLNVLLAAKVQDIIAVNHTSYAISSTTTEKSFNKAVKSKASSGKLTASKCLNNYSAGTSTTTLRPAVERIFSRSKRFLLATPKTRLKFTLQISKRLLANYPTGFNFNIEAACYYPMITSRLDLIPKPFRPKTTPKPKHKGPTTPLFVHIPGSLLRYKAKPAAKPAKIQRIDELAGQPLQWVQTKPAAPTSAVSQYYTQPLKWQQWSKYGAPGYAQRYEWTPAKQWPDKQPVWSKWTTSPLPWAANKKWQQKANKWQQWDSSPAAGGTWPQHARWKRDSPRLEVVDNAAENAAQESDADLAAADEFSSDEVLKELEEIEPMYVHFPELEAHHEWKHYHSYRDRRQLFHQLDGLSGILGIDLKSCVLRAICDCKRFLLPPGYSLVQDILRQMFTFPTKSGLTDEYSRIVKQDYVECDRELRTACPFNVLDWLMGQKLG